MPAHLRPARRRDDLPSVACLLTLSDNVVAPLAADHRFRTARDPQVFTAVLRTIPVYAAWLEVMDPITGVFPMAGLHNTLRRLAAGGTPVAPASSVPDEPS